MTTGARSAGNDTIAGEIQRILERHVSAMTARSILTMAREQARVTHGPLLRGDVPRLLDRVMRGVGLFVTTGHDVQACRRELELLAQEESDRDGRGVSANRLATVTIAIRAEADIGHARGAAREMASELGFSQVEATKLATATSELARNIVQYAGEGTIELHPVQGATPSVEIVARDRGPGIADADLVLSGRYRSKLGMGLGLRGVRKLVARFELDTAKGRGTTVRALMVRA